MSVPPGSGCGVQARAHAVLEERCRPRVELRTATRAQVDARVACGAERREAAAGATSVRHPGAPSVGLYPGLGQPPADPPMSFPSCQSRNVTQFEWAPRLGIPGYRYGLNRLGHTGTVAPHGGDGVRVVRGAEGAH